MATMADRKKEAARVMAEDTREMRGGSRSAPAAVPDREPSRGLEGHGFSASESRTIHRAAGNEGFGLEAQRKQIDEKVKAGKMLTQEDLY